MLFTYIQISYREMDSKYVRGYMLSVAVVGDEIVRTGMTMFPYISVGFTIMSTFSIITVYISATYFKQVLFLLLHVPNN